MAGEPGMLLPQSDPLYATVESGTYRVVAWKTIISGRLLPLMVNVDGQTMPGGGLAWEPDTDRHVQFHADKPRSLLEPPTE